MTDVLEKLRLLFRPKRNRAGARANCMSRRTRVVGSSRLGRLYTRCTDCGHTWKHGREWGNGGL